MSTAGSSISGEDILQPKVNPWIIAVAVSLTAFMGVLDTSIASVALPHIAGHLGARCSRPIAPVSRAGQTPANVAGRMAHIRPLRG
jgi:hypothetical protein